MPYVGQTITDVFPTSISVDSATISGNTTIGGTLGVTGATTLSNQLTDANMSSGSVLQVVQVFKDDVFSTTSTSYVDVTGMSATITPSSSSNKILVQLRTTQAMDGNNKMTTNLVRGSTTIANADGKTYFSNMYPSRLSTDTNIYLVHGSTHLDFLDTPSTTSSTTYKLQLLVDSGTGYINRGRDSEIFRGVSSITLMEIAV